MGKRLRKRSLPIARRKPLSRRLLTLVGAVAGGAVLKHFFDPERGAGRRSRAADQAAATVRQPLESTADRVTDAVQVATEKAKGLATEATTTDAEQLPDNDPTLADKIRSEVLGDDRWKDTKVNVTAVDGTVTLHGQVRTPAEIKALLKAVRDVPGVNEVESNLHLPDTPAPNTQDSRDASAKGGGTSA